MVAASPPACPVQVVGKRIEHAGRVVYRVPPIWTGPGIGAVKCSGKVVWVYFTGGFASNQQQYVAVRSENGGRTFRPVAAEGYFGIKAPHEFSSYAGPWAIVGERAAYFVGACPACGNLPVYGSVYLFVTLDGGRTFHRYDLPALNGYWQKLTLWVAGDDVTVGGVREGRTERRWATVDVR